MPIFLVPGNYYQRVSDSVQEDGVRETTIGELLPESLGPGHLLLKPVPFQNLREYGVMNWSA